VGLASSSNTVANQYKYTPWGLSESTSETVAQPLRFMAREYDATTGLYYVRARSYDPAPMRKIALSTLGILAFSTGCSDVRQSQRITNHSSPCISFGADSSGIADAALAALLAVAPDSANLNKLKVERFESDSGGTRVTFVPGILMSGGGGAVWVPNSGCAVVRELFE